jgi:hypothetical protein
MIQLLPHRVKCLHSKKPQRDAPRSSAPTPSRNRQIVCSCRASSFGVALNQWVRSSFLPESSYDCLALPTPQGDARETADGCGDFIFVSVAPVRDRCQGEPIGERFDRFEGSLVRLPIFAVRRAGRIAVLIGGRAWTRCKVSRRPGRGARRWGSLRMMLSRAAKRRQADTTANAGRLARQNWHVYGSNSTTPLSIRPRARSIPA